MLKRKSWKKRVGALVMACCAATSLSVSSLAVAAPSDGVSLTGGDVYTTYNGTVQLKYLVAMDKNSATYRCMVGGLFQTAMKDGAAEALTTSSIKAYKVSNPDDTLDTSYNPSNQQTVVTARDETTQEYYLGLTLRSVKAEPQFSITAVERYSKGMIDLVEKNSSASALVPMDKIAYEQATVHFVYPISVASGDHGRVTYAGNDYVDADDSLTPRNLTVYPGQTANSYVEYNTPATFTITPDANYSIADVTVSVNGGAATSVLDQVTVNGQGVGTLTYNGLSTMTNENDTYAINVTYGHEVKGTVSGGNGTVAIDNGTPTDTTVTKAVLHGGSATFHMAPASQYCVDTVSITGYYPGSSATIIPKANLTNDTSVTAKNAKLFEIENVEKNVSLTVTYAEDKNENDIPDKYELTFTFKAGQNGTIGGATADITVAKPKLDTSGNYSTTGTATLTDADVPAVAGSPAASQGVAGYLFDYWTKGTEALTRGDEKAPAGAYAADTTFTANFAYDDGDLIPDKYQMKFTFTADANGTITSKPNFVIKTKLSNAADPNSWATDGKVTLTPDEVKKYGAFTPNAGFVFNCWHDVAANINLTKGDETAPAKEYTGDVNATQMEEMTFQAMFENGNATIFVPSSDQTKILKGAWDNDTNTTFDFYLQIGGAAASEEAMQRVAVTADLVRVDAKDFPGEWTSYMGSEGYNSANRSFQITIASAPSDSTTDTALAGQTGTWRKGTIKIGPNTAGILQSSIVMFTATYDDGTTSGKNLGSCTVIVPGDVNRDGQITSRDTNLLTMSILSLTNDDTNKRYFKELADINADSTLTTRDTNILTLMMLSQLPSN